MGLHDGDRFGFRCVGTTFGVPAKIVMSIEFLDKESNDFLDTESMEFLDSF